MLSRLLIVLAFLALASNAPAFLASASNGLASPGSAADSAQPSAGDSAQPSAMADYNKAIYFLFQDNKSSAITHYERALLKDSVILAEDDMGLLDSVLDSYRKRIMNDLENPALRFRLARLYYRAGKPDKAIGALEKLMEIISDPDNVIYQNSKLALRQIREEQESISSYVRAEADASSELSPKNRPDDIVAPHRISVPGLPRRPVTSTASGKSASQERQNLFKLLNEKENELKRLREEIKIYDALSKSNPGYVYPAHHDSLVARYNKIVDEYNATIDKLKAL